MSKNRIFNLAKIFVEEKEYNKLIDEIDHAIKNIDELYNLDFSDLNFSDFNNTLELNMDLDKIKRDIILDEDNNDVSKNDNFSSDLLLNNDKKNDLLLLKLKSTILQE